MNIGALPDEHMPGDMHGLSDNTKTWVPCISV